MGHGQCFQLSETDKQTDIQPSREDTDTEINREMGIEAAKEKDTAHREKIFGETGI